MLPAVQNHASADCRLMLRHRSGTLSDAGGLHAPLQTQWVLVKAEPGVLLLTGHCCKDTLAVQVHQLQQLQSGARP